LKELDINATNIHYGLQFIPLDNLYHFTCGDKGRNDALVNHIKRMLGFTETTASEEENPLILLHKVQRIDDWQQVFRYINQQQIAQIQQTHSPLYPRNH